MSTAHFPQGRTEVDADDVLREALRNKQEIRLRPANDQGFVLEIDGVPFPGPDTGFPWETFQWPIHDLDVHGESCRELVAELEDSINSRRTRHRNSIPATQNHALAEGTQVPPGGGEQSP